jgi:DNA-binding CsgD family transcriptional regulator
VVQATDDDIRASIPAPGSGPFVVPQEIGPELSGLSDILCDVATEAAAGGVFVGRAEEAERLRRLVGLTGGGHGSVLLSGDAGIGKTRVLSDLVENAREQGWRVLVGHCLGEAGRTLPYLPFSEIVARVEQSDPEIAAQLVKDHPQLENLTPGRRRVGEIRAGHDDGSDAIDRSDLVEAVHGALEDLSRLGPVLLVVEDVHWADESSRDLLTLLFTRGFRGPVSIVASYRSDDLHRRHPLRTTLAHWSRLPDLRRLDLGSLPDSAVRELVDALRPGALSAEQVDAVVQRAEGNAFFTEELVAASALGHHGVAEDLSRLLLVRFDQLGPNGQRVVRLASAAGRTVSHAVLEAVADLEPAAFDEGVREAVERNVLVATDSGGYAFRHALLAETVYDDLLPGERVRAHERYAAVLAERRGLGPWADLARHAAAAGDRETALDAHVKAGDLAMSVGGPREAFDHYERALGLMSTGDERTDAITLKAAAASTAVGGAVRAVALLHERLSRRPDTAPVLGRVELLAALATTARVIDGPTDTLAATKEGLVLLEGLREDDSESRRPQVRARLLAAHVQALADRGRDDQATTTADLAVEAAIDAGLPEVAAEVRVVRARIIERVIDPDASRETLEELIARETSPGDPAAMRARHHLASLHHRSGRLEEAVRVYGEGAARARQSGQMWAPYALENRLLAGLAAYEAGLWDDSARFLDTRRDHPPQPAASMFAGARLLLTAARGETGWEVPLAQARHWWEVDGLVAVFAGGAAIDLHGNAGDIEAAVAAYDDVVEVLARLWHPRFQAQLRFAALLLGQLASHVQKVPTAQRATLVAKGAAVADEAEAVWALQSQEGHTGPESLAWLARMRAESLRLRWLAGEEVPPELLVEAWRAAVASFEEYGHPYETARSQVRLGTVLQAMGNPAGALEVRAALETARRLRAEPLLAEVRASGGARPPKRPADRAGEDLTPREREILALVALGRSNRQIGTQLFISNKTASVHVSNIIAKLGVTSRGEAVAVARERGLLD